MAELNPQNLSERELGRLLTAAIIPRAIGWISTVSADGIPNLGAVQLLHGGELLAAHRAILRRPAPHSRVSL